MAWRHRSRDTVASSGPHLPIERYSRRPSCRISWAQPQYEIFPDWVSTVPATSSAAVDCWLSFEEHPRANTTNVCHTREWATPTNVCDTRRWANATNVSVCVCIYIFFLILTVEIWMRCYCRPSWIATDHKFYSFCNVMRAHQWVSTSWQAGLHLRDDDDCFYYFQK